MSIYKPSLLSPSLSEIDVTQNNIFSCQVNTSGPSINRYKMQIYSADGNELLYDGNTISLANPVKNKDTLSWTVTPAMLGTGLINGRDYQWNVRTYEFNAAQATTEKPRTLVCTGFLVGTTRYVIWTYNNDLIEEGRYVQFSTTKSQMFPIVGSNPENLELPTGNHVERHRIEWVDSELGTNKDYTKIELDEPFTYNYINDTTFSLYKCSDKHTLTSVYVDPNDLIERGKYIVLSTSSTKPSDSTKKRKIIGYGEETGEIRVQESFDSVPTNGMYCFIYSFDSTASSASAQWELLTTTPLVVGGTAVNNSTFKVRTNTWSSTAKRLFIQPNINIKPDLVSPDEIVFDLENNTRIRLDIIQKRDSKGNDITFNKLDNTQWIVDVPQLPVGTPSTVIPPTAPQTPYQVFTDFQDSAPMAYFYARKTPTIIMKYKNYNDNRLEWGIIDSDLVDNPQFPGVPWRDILFGGIWQSTNGVEIKYYQYFLYDEDGTEIGKSEEKYDDELTWYFRGFQTPDDTSLPGNIYEIKLVIVDEYDKEFVTSKKFRVKYFIDENFVPLDVQLNCEERGMDIKVVTPAFVETTDWGNIPTVTVDDLDKKNHYLSIPDGKILNYTNLKDIQKSPYIIPNDFTYYTQFQLQQEFVESMEDGQERMIMEFSYTNNNNEIVPVKLTFGGINTYVNNNDTFIKNENRFKLLLYMNNEPAYLLKNSSTGEMLNYIDLSTINNGFISPSSLRFALQYTDSYIVISTFPVVPTTGTLYLLTNTITRGNRMYYPGVYTWETNGGWTIESQYEYMYLDTLNQFPGQTYASLNTPGVCREGLGKKGFKWSDENTLWIDTEHVQKANKEIIEKYWFEFYFVSKGEKQTCEIRVNTRRK